MQHHPDSLRQPEHFCRTLPIRLPLSLLLATTLSACGGGGGGVTTDTAAPPTQVTPPVTAPVATATTPLALTAASAKLAPTLAFGYGATPLAVAQMVIDWTSRVSTSATLPRTCSNGGSQIASYTDTDGNRRVSSGDKLSVTYTRCRVKELDGIIDGTMNIAFTAPSNGQQLAGTISFAPGFGDHTEIPHQDLVGSVRFDHASGALSKLLHVYSDTQPFVMSFSDAGITRNETITALDVQHELRIDTARASASMRYHLASDLLVGSLDVSTRSARGSILSRMRANCCSAAQVAARPACASRRPTILRSKACSAIPWFHRSTTSAWNSCGAAVHGWRKMPASTTTTSSSPRRTNSSCWSSRM